MFTFNRTMADVQKSFTAEAQAIVKAQQVISDKESATIVAAEKRKAEADKEKGKAQKFVDNIAKLFD